MAAKINYFLYCKSVINVSFGLFYPNRVAYERFNMALSAKRAYNKNGSNVAKDCNDILNYSFVKEQTLPDGKIVKIPYNKDSEITNEFIYKYLALKINIDDGGNLVKIKFDKFISEILTVLINDKMISLIEKYINSHYIGDVDSKNKKQIIKFDPSTTFRDSDNKCCFMVKYIGNLLIPLCTHYCKIMSHEIDPRLFFYQFYVAIFNLTNKIYKIDLLKKLHIYVERITARSYSSNIGIFDRMSIAGVTINTEVDDNFNKVLTTIITKLDLKQGSGVPGFIAKTVKNSSANWNIRRPDGYDILDPFDDVNIRSGSEENQASQAERIDSYMKRPDEFLKVVRRNMCEDTIRKISTKLGIFIDINSHEYGFTLENNISHKYQTQIIFHLFEEFYGGYDNLLDNNKLNYTHLLLIAEKYLRDNGHNIIANYITATNEGYCFTNRWAKHSDKLLYEDSRYLDLLNGPYKFVKEAFIEKDIIKQDCLLMFNNKYVNNGYGSELGKMLIYDYAEIIDAVLNYYVFLNK